MVRDGSLRSTKLSTLALKGWNTWIITPLKINMEPKKHPSEKRKLSSKPPCLPFLGSMLIFQGVVFRRCSAPNVNGRISLLAVDFNQQCHERDLGSSLNDYIVGWQQCAFDYDICFYPTGTRRDMHHEPATCTCWISLQTSIYPGNSVSQRFQGCLGSTVQQKHMTCWDHHKLQ